MSETPQAVRSLDQAVDEAIVAKLDRRATFRAQCKTAGEAIRESDLSEAARVHAKRVGGSREIVNCAAEHAEGSEESGASVNKAPNSCARSKSCKSATHQLARSHFTCRIRITGHERRQ
jgi:hypothetical protein